MERFYWDIQGCYGKTTVFGLDWNYLWAKVWSTHSLILCSVSFRTLKNTLNFDRVLPTWLASIIELKTVKLNYRIRKYFTAVKLELFALGGGSIVSSYSHWRRQTSSDNKKKAFTSLNSWILWHIGSIHWCSGKLRPFSRTS